ncbi:MAG: hypothetical protein HZA53_05870 [Planctomycetes bacterium]|nr:hypothetical protein [Planctomycetota bacterium]
MNVYLELTREFNAGRLRTIVCNGQAAVLHKLAISSKDGDWILREDDEALRHVLDVLARRGARYRFGAPLDLAWMRGGWSAHFEFAANEMRVRTDFFTRPPRVSAVELARLWREQEGRDPPFTDARILAEMKKTDREKDYPFIGELARLMPDPRDQIRYSRSADDLIELAARHPGLVRELTPSRSLLARIAEGRRALAEAIQLEMLDCMEVNERRIRAYLRASEGWKKLWPALEREVDSLDLPQAHAFVVERARGVLPPEVGP